MTTASQAAARIREALEESRDDVVNTLNSYVDHPANERKRGLIEQQLARHDAAAEALRALLAERDELLEALKAARHHIEFMRSCEKSVRAVELQSEALQVIDAALTTKD